MDKKPYNRNEWTDKELDTLCRYYPVMTAKNIATILTSRSVTSIYRKAKELLLKGYNIREERTAIHRMRSQGMSVDEICARSGYPKRTVYRRLHDYTPYKPCRP